MKKDHNQLNWLMVSLIAFNMVWGLGNVVNNYSTQGISVIVSWILILAIYFIPYPMPWLLVNWVQPLKRVGVVSASGLKRPLLNGSPILRPEPTGLYTFPIWPKSLNEFWFLSVGFSKGMTNLWVAWVSNGWLSSAWSFLEFFSTSLPRAWRLWKLLVA